LIERLNAGLHRKLTLISAPAGFGKTTLPSEWVAGYGLHTRVAWLSLDEGDNDLVRFLAYFAAALQTIEGNVGQGLLVALQSPGAVNVELILTTLLNEIAGLPDAPSTGPSTGSGHGLGLDDYHVIESQPVDNALNFTLDYLPPQMHLAIASRTDPSLPLIGRCYDTLSDVPEFCGISEKGTPKEKSSLLCKVAHSAKGQVRSERRPASCAHRCRSG